MNQTIDVWGLDLGIPESRNAVSPELISKDK